MKITTNTKRIALFFIKCSNNTFKGLRSKQTITCVYNYHTYQVLKPHNASKTTTAVPSTADMHTVKGWKVIAKTGQKSNEIYNPEEHPVSCEEGSTAVLHETLVSALQSCASMQDQIETFCSLTSIPAEEIQRRKELCESLEPIFKIYFNKFKVHQFGSGINNLGFSGCDMDISLQTTFSNEEVVTLESVPTVEDVLEGRVSSDTVARMKPRYLLRFIRRIFRKHSKDINENILLIKARIPILRFYNAKYDLFCDFSCENRASLINTRFLRFLGYLDDRFIPLAKILRYWGKYGGFVGDIERFNSYAFSLLVIYFLQVTSPPVLPPIQEIIAKSEYIKHGEMCDTAMILEDVKKFEKSQNKKSVDELLGEFFFYYLLNDYSRVMVPQTGTSIPKFDFKGNENEDGTNSFEMSTVALQDPFRVGFNATFGATYKSCRRFMSGLVHACSVYQNPSLWNPTNPLWGLCSIFHKPLMEEETHQNLVHQLQLPIKESGKAANVVRGIFEHALLFRLTEFTVKDSNEQNSQLKVTCQAHANTWQGRNVISVNQVDTKSTLENEHLVSKELLQKRIEYYRKLLLAQFMCEGKEVEKSGQKYFVLTLTFQESKFPPVVAIFLKEYIPVIFKKCIDENDVKYNKL